MNVVPAKRRTRLAVLTSCRELRHDESIGLVVHDSLAERSLGYRAGIVETLALELIRDDSALARDVELAAVIVDDDADEFAAAWCDGDVWPQHAVVRNETGPERPLREITYSVPARPWRELRPIGGEDQQSFRTRRSALRQEFEATIANLLSSQSVDLVLCDSFMTILRGPLLARYRGRCLNVHPGIIDPLAPCHLLGATPTRDAFTRAVFGYVIVDDKRMVAAPAGERIHVSYGGRVRIAVRVQKISETGVTVHVMTEAVDDGPVVCASSYAFDPSKTTLEQIRAANHELKRKLVPMALTKFVGA